MEKLQGMPFLEKERSSTDQSLNAERDKTNESLLKGRDEVERHTDRIVQSERDKIDKSALEARNKIDSNNRQNQKEEFSGVIMHLKRERLESDKTIELERSKVDKAIELERNLKETMANRLLGQERELTDKNLSAERCLTDSRVEDASTKLEIEIAGHSQTKISLTTRDEFLAIVSHDLKNPIGAIFSCADMLLQDGNLGSMSSDLKSWIDFIKRNADISLRLISDLLDVERIAQGMLQVKIEKQKISKIISQAVETFTQPATAKKLTLVYDPPDISDVAFCDHDRVLQVLSNLIANAIKFTSKGGSILVRTEIQDDKLVVSVCDTGSGIPEDKKEQIFDRFAQLSSKDRTGLGLGLYISKMLIEAQAGHLWVVSKLGEGSKFYFSLPRELKI